MLEKKWRIGANGLETLKQKTTYTWCIYGLKTTFNLEIKHSEVKSQDTMCDWFAWG